MIMLQENKELPMLLEQLLTKSIIYLVFIYLSISFLFTIILKGAANKYRINLILLLTIIKCYILY